MAAPVRPDERTQLAILMDGFRTGQLTLRRFHGLLPPLVAAADPGVAQVADALYSWRDHDLWAWRRRWSDLPAGEQECLDRCRRFLGTALPYDWPEPPDTVLPELARAGVLLLWIAALSHLLFALVIGVLGIVHDAPILILNAAMLTVACAVAITGAVFAGGAVRHWTTTAWQRYTAAGDGTAWPFLRRADYEGAAAAAVISHFTGHPSD